MYGLNQEHDSQSLGLTHETNAGVVPLVDWQTQMLLDSVRRHDHFATDATDEFQITREGGSPQGIFKVWASPVIPHLEHGPVAAPDTAQNWATELSAKPLQLHESLEGWRAYSSLSDRRLQQVFEGRELPTGNQATTVELYSRLQIAFAYAAPFYHIEAMVADPRTERPDNPVNFDEETKGGALDAVAMVLPAAMKNHVVAERLEWNGLNWDTINSAVDTMRQDFLSGSDSLSARQFVQLSRVASRAGISQEDVLFVANALEFIPMEVGGKKGDLAQPEALAVLDTLLDGPTTAESELHTGSVAKNTNALIRFLNWTTAIQAPTNFEGKYWSYDSVCDTSATLVDHIKTDPEQVFIPGFAETFVRELAPQLDNLDASSAKGRFMLQLLHEGKIDEDLADQIARRSTGFIHEIVQGMRQIAEDEQVIDVDTRGATTYLVGGKAHGLRKAQQLFGPEKVQPGNVLTSEAVNTWLEGVDGVSTLIKSLEAAPTVEEKVAIGEEITQTILAVPTSEALIRKIQDLYPDGRHIVLRSSSFDEDVDFIGPAPGIYESEIDIDPTDAESVADALKNVVNSYFSDKAISFRELKGLQHTPHFAVLIQEYVDGAGGSVFIHNGSIQLNIASRPSDVNDTERHVEELLIPSTGEEVSGATRPSEYISADHIKSLQQIAIQSHDVYGPSDIEFVVHPDTDELRILQLRALQRPVSTDDSTVNGAELTTVAVDDLDALPNLNEAQSINLRVADSIDPEKFQGTLFRWIVTNRGKIKSITLPHKIPKTSHFANIVESLGISLHS